MVEIENREIGRMSTKKKSSSLSALESSLLAEIEGEKSISENTEALTSSAAKKKKDKQPLPTYPPLEVHEQLRRLAFEERTSINALTLEAWDLLFAKRGLKSIKELTTQK